MDQRQQPVQHDVVDLTDKLPPGRHLLAWEMEGTGKFDGVVGDMWIEFVPDPVFTQSLAGEWSPGTLPGRATLTGASGLSFSIRAGKTTWCSSTSTVNAPTSRACTSTTRTSISTAVPTAHHRRMTLNPWLDSGGENEIELRPYYNEPMDIESVELRSMGRTSCSLREPLKRLAGAWSSYRRGNSFARNGDGEKWTCPLSRRSPRDCEGDGPLGTIASRSAGG